MRLNSNLRGLVIGFFGIATAGPLTNAQADSRLVTSAVGKQGHGLELTPAQLACQPATHLNGPGGWKPFHPEIVSVPIALSPDGTAQTFEGVTAWVKYRDWVDNKDPQDPIQKREYKLIGINHSKTRRSVSFIWIDKEQPTVVPIMYFRNVLEPGQIKSVCDVWNIDPVHPLNSINKFQVDPL